MDSNSSVSSTASNGTGCRSTVYVPAMSETPEILQTPAMVCGEDELYASESDEVILLLQTSEGTILCFLHLQFYLLETEPEQDLRRSFSLTTLARSMTPRFMATSTFIEEILVRFLVVKLASG